MTPEQYSAFCYAALVTMTAQYNSLVDAINSTQDLNLKKMPTDFPAPPEGSQQ